MKIAKLLTLILTFASVAFSVTEVEKKTSPTLLLELASKHLALESSEPVAVEIVFDSISEITTDFNGGMPSSVLSDRVVGVAKEIRNIESGIAVEKNVRLVLMPAKDSGCLALAREHISTDGTFFIKGRFEVWRPTESTFQGAVFYQNPEAGGGGVSLSPHEDMKYSLRCGLRY